MKLFDVLPYNIANAMEKLNFDNITEIRLRKNRKATVLYNNSYLDLKEKNCEDIIVTQEMINTIVERSCENSVFAYSNQIVNGFITLFDGARIGLSGYAVVENDEVNIIKDINALNIRIPHNIENVSKSLINFFCMPLSSTLVISPPSGGKTTFLRDMIRQVNRVMPSANILVADERNELIFEASDLNCDTYYNCSRSFSMTNGLRSMSPDIVVCDEISINDIEYLQQIRNSGVFVYASIHANNINQVESKIDLADIKKIFDNIIVLSRRNGIGTVEYAGVL